MALFDVSVGFRVKGEKKLSLILDKLSDTIPGYKGVVADSALFLWIAFGSLAFLKGQVVGKLWMTALAVALVVSYRAFRDARTVEA